MNEELSDIELAGRFPSLTTSAARRAAWDKTTKKIVPVLAPEQKFFLEESPVRFLFFTAEAVKNNLENAAQWSANKKKLKQAGNLLGIEVQENNSLLGALALGSFEREALERQTRKKEQEQLAAENKSAEDRPFAEGLFKGDVSPLVWAEAETRKEEEAIIKSEGVTISVTSVEVRGAPTLKGERRVVRFRQRYYLFADEILHLTNGAINQCDFSHWYVKKSTSSSSFSDMNDEEFELVGADRSRHGA